MKVALEGLHLMNCLHHNRLEASFQENAENQRRRRKIWCRFVEMTLLTISMISLQTKIQIRACILVSKHESVPNISTPLIDVIEKTNFTFPFSPNILDFLVLSDCAAKSMLKYFPSHTKLLFI